LPQQSPEIDYACRVGAATLSAATGAVLGLLLGAVLLYAGLNQSLSLTIAGGALAGGLAGALWPVGAIDFVEGTIHFLVGFFSASYKVALDAEDSSLFDGQTQRPQWLRWAFTFGVIFAVVAWAFFQF
jgi:hypothetical protein